MACVRPRLLNVADIPTNVPPTPSVPKYPSARLNDQNRSPAILLSLSTEPSCPSLSGAALDSDGKLDIFCRNSGYLLLAFLTFRRRANRPFMGGGISYQSYVPRSPSILPDSPRAPAAASSVRSPTLPTLPVLPEMSYVGGGSGLSAGRGELFPSMISTSTGSGSGMLVSPVPTERSDADIDVEAGVGAGAGGRWGEPRMRETVVSSAGASVRRGAGHASLSAEAVMVDPFADPTMGAHAAAAEESLKTPKEPGSPGSPGSVRSVSTVRGKAEDPFADPGMSVPQGQERLSVLSVSTSNVQPGEAM